VKKIKMHYIWERIYPHIIALCITVCLVRLGFDPIQSDNIDSLVEGIVTLDSIIIGFIGAIIPIILSMKNESKIVKYVFDRDKKGLFKKYISETIGYGLADVCVSLSVYVKDLVINKCILTMLGWLLLYAFILFILSTYRSLTCMLKIIFADDKRIEEKPIINLGRTEKEALWKEKGK
jgi:hypothetical protein